MNKKKLYDRPHVEVVKAETTKTICGSIAISGDYDVMP